MKYLYILIIGKEAKTDQYTHLSPLTQKPSAHPTLRTDLPLGCWEHLRNTADCAKGCLNNSDQGGA